MHSLTYAIQQLSKEYLDTLRQPPDPLLLHLAPISPDDLTQWTATIAPPAHTLYHPGYYTLSITLPPTYPLTPPTISFTTRIAHPNVAFKTGEICLDVLKEAWTPAWGVRSACLAVVGLLESPGWESPLDGMRGWLGIMLGGMRVGILTARKDPMGRKRKNHEVTCLSDYHETQKRLSVRHTLRNTILTLLKRSRVIADLESKADCLQRKSAPGKEEKHRSRVQEVEHYTSLYCPKDSRRFMSPNLGNSTHIASI
ncbi:hypothetical protein G7K_1676-t1 [Saitoella complicata NRRL Y-17804]|uniref:UBC core domain-containing protein n=1 Tax=Saitoella complicata (strain BCRC 22490 / CBS 7301 / JCM 7358 / NBRC 10748 / NRRL Y-17804) TaxID=698492 RepID=A0A0E9NCB4_SAICN|nr:hypothetical protein G7K_1676-t1 [Saitoella complicata NRRL Y-17804]